MTSGKQSSSFTDQPLWSRVMRNDLQPRRRFARARSICLLWTTGEETTNWQQRDLPLSNCPLPVLFYFRELEEKEMAVMNMRCGFYRLCKHCDSRWAVIIRYKKDQCCFSIFFLGESGCYIQKSHTEVIHENKMTLFVASVFVLLVSPRSQLVRVEVCHTSKAISHLVSLFQYTPGHHSHLKAHIHCRE